MQLLDADYFLNANKPVVRLYGKTENGNSVCAFYDKFLPYFYVRPNSKTAEAVKNIREIVSSEEIEKFTPSGYQAEPAKLLKLTITNPQDVPRISAMLLDQKAVDDIFENDILFKYRFMVDHSLRGMEWVDVKGQKTFTKTVTCPAYGASSISAVNKKENAGLRYMAFDIECIPSDITKPLNSKKDPIVIIAMSFTPRYKNHDTLVLVAKPASGQGTQGFQNEKAMLEEFLKIISAYDPDIITGYNINSFDLPYLLERLGQNKLPKFFGRCNDKPVFTKTFGISQETVIHGRVVVDPYQIIKRDPWVKFYRYNLNTIAKALLGEEKLDVEYSEMPDLWKGSREDLNRFVEYARKDAAISLRLVIERRMLDKFFEISKISGLLMQDVFGGQTMRIEVMLLHEFRKRRFVMPSKTSRTTVSRREKEKDKLGLKGATVLEPKKGLHTEGCTLVLDFKSLYPNLMRAYNISPDSLLTGGSFKCNIAPNGAKFIDKEIHEGIFPLVLTQLLESRESIKKLMKTARGEEKRILNARQLALKDISNSIYGYTGYVRARLYMIDVAGAITAYGRENLEKTKKTIEEKFPVEVVYGDTDSLLLKTSLTNLDEAKELGEKISKAVSSELGNLQLEFQKIYRTFLILTKKRYAGWKFTFDGEWKDEIEMKGIETIRRDWCPLVSQTMKEILDIILKEGDMQKAIATMRNVLEKLKRNEIPLEMLTVIKGITKSPENYEGMLPHIELAKKLAERNPHDKPRIGDRLGFVIIKGNQILSKRAEDPGYVKKHNLQIDSDYYIHSQLFPPIERILVSIGVTKGELLGSGHQSSIMDIMNGTKRRTKHEINIDFSKEDDKKALDDWENFVCQKCSKSYRRMPLQGSCACGGELLIAYQGSVSNRMVRKG